MNRTAVLHPRRHWSGFEPIHGTGLSAEEIRALRAKALRWTAVIVAIGGLAVYLWIG